MDNLSSIQFVYRGHVQGVWFRKTAAEIARRAGVVGYVMNLPDGSVEAVVCGTAQSVADFATAVAEHYRDHISECTQVPWSGTEAFTRFDIRY